MFPLPLPDRLPFGRLVLLLLCRYNLGTLLKSITLSCRSLVALLSHQSFSKVSSPTTLLLLIQNVNTDSSHNGLWKVNIDGTGLTRLISNTVLLSGTANEEIGFISSFTWAMDLPWANASRDGTYYSLEVYNRSGGPNRLLIGPMNGGAPVTFVTLLS